MNCKENLTAWEVFVVTAKTGSVSQTSLLTDLPLSKVSRLIAGLEAEFGFALFDKRRRPLVLTDRGAELALLAEPLLQGFRELNAHFRDENRITTYRFSAPIEVAQFYFSSLLCRYSSLNPDIQFDICPEVRADAVRNGEIDIAVINQHPADTTDLVIRPYCTAGTVVLATPEYLSRNGMPQTPADLREHTGLLLRTVNHEPTQLLFRHGESSQLLRWKKIFLTHDQMTLRRLVLDHQGITVDLYVGHVLDEIRSGQLVPILPGWARSLWRMCVVTRRDAEMRSPELTRCAQWLAGIGEIETRRRVVEGNRIVDEAWRRLGLCAD